MQKKSLFFSEKKQNQQKIQQSNSKEKFLRVFLRLKEDYLDQDSDRVFVLNQDIKCVLFCKKQELQDQKYVTTFMFDDILENKQDDNQCFETISKKYLQNSFTEKKDLITFAYGNTNSGKTYNIIGDKNYQGLLLKTMDWILTQKDKTKINFTAFEIYNEKIFDLLSKDTKQFESVDYSNKIVSSQQLLKKLNKETIKDNKQFQKILKLTQQNKRMGENLINKNSSRSHCIYKINVKFLETDKQISILLVDLAGVERNKSESNENISSKQFGESKNINLSLSALLRCFRALRQDEFLPYRESVLTKIIFEHLDKNIQINFLITFDPNYKHFENNFRVLDFSYIAKNIKPSVFKNNAQFKDLKEKKVLYQNSKSLFGHKFISEEEITRPYEKLIVLKTNQFKNKMNELKLKMRKIKFQEKIQTFRRQQIHQKKQDQIDFDFKQSLRQEYIQKYCNTQTQKSELELILANSNKQNTFIDENLLNKACQFNEQNFKRKTDLLCQDFLRDFSLKEEESNKENVRTNQNDTFNKKNYFNVIIDKQIYSNSSKNIFKERSLNQQNY